PLGQRLGHLELDAHLAVLVGDEVREEERRLVEVLPRRDAAEVRSGAGRLTRDEPRRDARLAGPGAEPRCLLRRPLRTTAAEAAGAAGAGQSGRHDVAREPAAVAGPAVVPEGVAAALAEVLVTDVVVGDLPREAAVAQVHALVRHRPAALDVGERL